MKINVTLAEDMMIVLHDTSEIGKIIPRRRSASQSVLCSFGESSKKNLENSQEYRDISII